MILENNSKLLTISQHSMLLVTSLTNGFRKFLTRFSGRRRELDKHIYIIKSKSPRNPNGHSHYFSNFKNCKFNIVSTLVLCLILNLIGITEACTSRNVPRPRTTTSTPSTTTSAPTTTPRPNITFPTFKCPGDYAKWYCLNGATCFAVQISGEYLFNCECRDGFMGPRCEYKELEGSYLATRPRVMLETASIFGGAFVAVFLAIAVAGFAYVRWHQNKKREAIEIESSQHPQNGNGHATNGHYNAGADVVDGRCNCQQSQAVVAAYSSQVESSSNLRNGDNNELQHPQQQQFRAVCHEHVHRVPLRPFGPHHDYQKISMSDAILHR